MRILHAADLHLDSPFASLSEEKAKLRRQESRQVLERLASLANERNAELVLLSGDLFDGANVYRETVEALESMLDAIRCPVFITPGNHDYYRPRSPYTKILFPEHVHLFAAPEIRAVALEKCIVYGAAFWEEQEPEGFLQGFQIFDDDDRMHIMCIHGDLTGGPYNPITKQQIAQSGLDYLALGHIHQYSGLQREGQTFYAYPGCSEGRGFDETGEKGCLLLEVEKGSVTAEFVPLCRRRYEICTVDVTERDIEQAAEEALAGYSDEDVIRLVLTGERQENSSAFRLEKCGQRFFGFEIVDQTREREDIWSRAGEDSLRGIFLQNLKDRYEAAQTDAERETVLMAAKVGLAALDNRDL